MACLPIPRFPGDFNSTNIDPYSAHAHGIPTNSLSSFQGDLRFGNASQQQVTKAITADIEEDSVCPIPALDWRSPAESLSNSPACSQRESPTRSTISCPAEVEHPLYPEHMSRFAPLNLSSRHNGPATQNLRVHAQINRAQVQHGIFRPVAEAEDVRPMDGAQQLWQASDGVVDLACGNWKHVVDWCKSAEITGFRIHMVDIQTVKAEDFKEAMREETGASPAEVAEAEKTSGEECVLYSLKIDSNGMDRWHHPAPPATLPLFAAQL